MIVDRPNAEPRLAEWIWSLPGGDLTVRCPARLTPEDYADVERLFGLILRQLKRWSGDTPPGK